MEELIEKIKLEGKVVGENILKVDSFLNHKVDPNLLKRIGDKFADIFRSEEATLVLTVESSGIAPALFTALALNVPLLFARKRKPLTLDDRVLQRRITSRTKLNEVTITLSKDYIKEGERVLIIDDFLATGETIKALCEMVEEAKGNVVGIGVCIEKTFQGGREALRGYRVVSLAKVDSLSPLSVRP